MSRTNTRTGGLNRSFPVTAVPWRAKRVASFFAIGLSIWVFASTFASDGRAYAQAYDQEIWNALAAIVPEERVAEFYGYAMNGVGASARSLSFSRAITPAYEGELGSILVEEPAVRGAVLNFVRNMPPDNVAAMERYLQAGSIDVAEWIQTSVPPEFLDDALNAAYRLSGEVGGTALGTALSAQAEAEIAGGAGSILRGLLSRVGQSFGTFLEWLSSTTVQGILGVYTIGTFTQEQINEALFAYQDEMEAIGDAADMEAFNNNLQLMLKALTDGRATLAPGLTMAEAVRQLRRNMNMGGSYFGNILVHRNPPVEPGEGSGYVGCYADNADADPLGLENRVLGDAMLPAAPAPAAGDPAMTTAKCTSFCAGQGFTFAGTQYGAFCFCGNSYEDAGISPNCNMKCSGDTGEICGGPWANSVYRVN